MSYIYYTNVPNIVFDIHLKELGYAELKVLLVIIRQTYGWKDTRTGTHKRWDWISQQFFVKKTKLSTRSVSTAIAKLVERKIILVRNERGFLLTTKRERQYQSKLYFSCNFITKSSELGSRKSVKKVHTTIIKHTNKYREESSQGLRKLKIRKIDKHNNR